MYFGSDGLKEEFKERLALQFTGGRTSHLSEMRNMEYALMMGALEDLVCRSAPKQHGLDLARKRVMAAIGAWLRSRHMTESAHLIKAVACRAAGVKDFNSIPACKLRGLYGEFRAQSKVGREAGKIVAGVDMELMLKN
jgi:hypothetical protein